MTFESAAKERVANMVEKSRQSSSYSINQANRASSGDNQAAPTLHRRYGSVYKSGDKFHWVASYHSNNKAHRLSINVSATVLTVKVNAAHKARLMLVVNEAGFQLLAEETRSIVREMPATSTAQVFAMWAAHRISLANPPPPLHSILPCHWANVHAALSGDLESLDVRARMELIEFFVTPSVPVPESRNGARKRKLEEILADQLDNDDAAFYVAYLVAKLVEGECGVSAVGGKPVASLADTQSDLQSQVNMSRMFDPKASDKANWTTRRNVVQAARSAIASSCTLTRELSEGIETAICRAEAAVNAKQDQIAQEEAILEILAKPIDELSVCRVDCFIPLISRPKIAKYC